MVIGVSRLKLFSVRIELEIWYTKSEPTVTLPYNQEDQLNKTEKMMLKLSFTFNMELETQYFQES